MPRNRDQLGQYREDDEARWRITRKYRPEWTLHETPMPEGDVFDAVQRALYAEVEANRKRHSFDPPAPTVTDCLDALRFADHVREMADYNEMRLIAFTRSRGATWQQIADALAYKTRQAAERRYRSLRRRWPGYEPPAPVVTPSDSDDATGQEGEQS